MSTAPMKAKMITLKSSDEHSFVIQEILALQSKTLEHMIAEKKETENIVIPLTDITGHILAKVIEYLHKHAEVETSDEDKKIWDEQFVNFEGTHILRDPEKRRKEDSQEKGLGLRIIYKLQIRSSSELRMLI
ncbi:hypothetical protein MKX03_005570 [Papaver bracteatum]|nr:hypothetical protein MKX03_005570 [Papaver bracteatum]